MTIDDILKDYFADISKSFPSVISTVVRTVAKIADNTSESSSLCCICENPCDNKHQYPEDWLRNITVNESALDMSSNSDLQASVMRRSYEHQDICYGCFIATKESKFPWFLQPRPSKQDILKEYEI